jgi:NAD(P)-dependent dehydrogenase (short-subunit alcohol dehydrogenase family)
VRTAHPHGGQSDRAAGSDYQDDAPARKPEDVANVAPFLPPYENSNVTGIDLVVDGGMKVW